MIVAVPSEDQYGSYECRNHVGSSFDGEPQPGSSVRGWPCGETYVRFFSARVSRLQQVTDAQKWVLGLSDAAKAITITANVRMVKAAAKQGVVLPSFVHRAMWLAGL